MHNQYNSNDIPTEIKYVIQNCQFGVDINGITQWYTPQEFLAIIANTQHPDTVIPEEDLVDTHIILRFEDKSFVIDPNNISSQKPREILIPKTVLLTSIELMLTKQEGADGTLSYAKELQILFEVINSPFLLEPMELPEGDAKKGEHSEEFNDSALDFGTFQ